MCSFNVQIYNQLSCWDKNEFFTPYLWDVFKAAFISKNGLTLSKEKQQQCDK